MSRKLQIDMANRLLSFGIRRLDVNEDEREVIWKAVRFYKFYLENQDIEFGEEPSL